MEVVQAQGGVLSLDDLRAHTSTVVEPITVNYRGVDVYEIPPNGQGLTALLALNVLEGFDLPSLGHNTTPYLHTLIEVRGPVPCGRVPCPTRAVVPPAGHAPRVRGHSVVCV